MAAGIVKTGRADATGSGATLWIGSELGSDTAVGSGTRLGMGATSGGTSMVGSGSGEAIAGNAGTGASVGTKVGAASGVRTEPVHATEAISAITSNARTPNSPPANGQVTGQPTVSRRKQVVSRGAECIGRFDPSRGLSLGCLLMRFALIPPMPIAPMPGLASRSGG
jgi:hypothetical protein